MKLFTLICGICFVLAACSLPDSDPAFSSTQATTPAREDSLQFPQSWLGNWQGMLKIFKDNQMVQTVPMELEIKAIDSTDNFTWAIIYGEDKIAGRRSYELETLDAGKGQYRIDERNSILLESYFYENKLLCWYEVMGNQILSSYEKKNESITFEIIFGNTEPVSITGDQENDGEDIPAVSTFPIGGFQHAVLRRK